MWKKLMKKYLNQLLKKKTIDPDTGMLVDVEPEREGVIIKIQKSRKDPIQTIQVKIDQEISEINQTIKNAFEEIH